MGCPLPLEQHSRRRIRPVNFSVTVLARAVNRLDRRRIAGGSVSDAASVTLGAEPGTLDLQHVLVAGAVRIMTVQAVVADRLMLPEEGAALVGMALVASLVDRGFAQQLVGR